jgi:hypothetical protein
MSVLFPEWTDFANRKPLLMQVFDRPMVELLIIHAKLLIPLEPRNA